jgi:hypothetical protein
MVVFFIAGRPAHAETSDLWAKVASASRSTVFVHEPSHGQEGAIEVLVPARSTDRLQPGGRVSLMLLDAHGSNTAETYSGVVGAPFVGPGGLLQRRVTFSLRGQPLPHRVDKAMLSKGLAQVLPIDTRNVSFHNGQGQPWHPPPGNVIGAAPAKRRFSGVPFRLPFRPRR